MPTEGLDVHATGAAQLRLAYESALTNLAAFEVGATGDLTITPTGTLVTIAAHVAVGDDKEIRLGAAPDYWLWYDATGTALKLTGTDVDGGGADGVIFKVEDGTDDVDFTGDVTLANLTITSFAANWTNAGRTVADLGIITTVDINGGTIDGAVIGGAAAAAGSFTTLGSTGAAVLDTGGTGSSFGGTLGVTGLVTASAGARIDGGSFGAGTLSKNATDGLSVGTITGATSDFSLYNPAGSQAILRVPTGTVNVTLEGRLQWVNNVSAFAAGSMYRNATNGITIGGVTGATNDLLIANNGGSTVLTVPTGTVNVALAGDLTVSGTGPHAIGGAALNYTAFRQTGAFTSGGAATIAQGWLIDRALTGAVGDTDYLTVAEFGGSVVTQGTDTNISVVAQAYFREPSITNNLASAGAPDIATTIYVAGAPTEGDTNAGIYNNANFFSQFPNTVAGTGLMVTTNDGSTQEVMRDSSSLALKEDVSPIALAAARAFLAVPAISYRLKNGGMTDWGFGAEHVHDAGLTDVIAYDGDRPSGFKTFGRGFVAAHHVLIQDHESRVARLEAAMLQLPGGAAALAQLEN